MSPGTHISVEQYLNTSFDDGDRKCIDGRIVETNVGKIDHGDLQGVMVTYLRTHYPGGLGGA